MTPWTRSSLALKGFGQNDPISRLIASLVERLVRLLPACGQVRCTLEKVVRFAGVGVASSFLYALAVTVATSGLRVEPDRSSIVGYAIAIPFNFLLHRHFTFRSAGHVRGDVARYAFAQVVGIAVSHGAMAVCVDGLGLRYGFGIAAALLLVPAITYLLLNCWVFPGASDRA